VVGALFFAALGFGFFLPTESKAILLDGFFSLIGFGMGLLSLRVAHWVQQPDDQSYQFGYAAFEPMLNAIKGLVILAVCLFAAADSIAAILEGGRDIEAGWGLFYAVSAGVGCFVLAAVQSRIAKRIGSRLVAVDARTWLADGILSAVAAAAFATAAALTGTRWESAVPYVDPGLVLVMALLMLPMPVRIVLGGASELLKAAPDPETQTRVHAAIRNVFDEGDVPEHRIRMVRIGREFWVLVHVMCPPDRSLGTAADLDGIRTRLCDAVAGIEAGMVTDVVFTADRKWM